jgi:hypothetical protein
LQTGRLKSELSKKADRIGIPGIRQKGYRVELVSSRIIRIRSWRAGLRLIASKIHQQPDQIPASTRPPSEGCSAGRR